MNNNIQQAYEQVRKFNTIAGNLNHADHEATLDGIVNQLEFIQSELDETTDALDSLDTAGVLQETCDLFVTVAGLMQRLEAAGCNVEKALARVNETNLSKFPTIFEHETNSDALVPDGYVNAVFTDYGHVVYKRQHDGKVMKPKNFVKVNVSSCVPNNIFGDVFVGDAE